MGDFPDDLFRHIAIFSNVKLLRTLNCLDKSITIPIPFILCTCEIEMSFSGTVPDENDSHEIVLILLSLVNACNNTECVEVLSTYENVPHYPSYHSILFKSEGAMLKYVNSILTKYVARVTTYHGPLLYRYLNARFKRYELPTCFGFDRIAATIETADLSLLVRRELCLPSYECNEVCKLLDVHLPDLPLMTFPLSTDFIQKTFVYFDALVKLVQWMTTRVWKDFQRLEHFNDISRLFYAQFKHIFPPKTFWHLKKNERHEFLREWLGKLTSHTFNESHDEQQQTRITPFLHTPQTRNFMMMFGMFRSAL